MTEVSVKIEIFGVSIFVIQCPEFPKARVDRLTGGDWRIGADSSGGFSGPDEGNKGVIWIGNDTGTPDMHEALAHEAVHAADWVIGLIGERSDVVELRAYIVGYIVRKTLERLLRAQA